MDKQIETVTGSYADKGSIYDLSIEDHFSGCDLTLHPVAAIGDAPDTVLGIGLNLPVAKARGF